MIHARIPSFGLVAIAACLLAGSLALHAQTRAPQAPAPAAPQPTGRAGGAGAAPTAPPTTPAPPAASSTTASPSSAAPSAAPGDYRIGPEDVLEVSVWRNDALTRTVPVRPDGKVSLPLLNDVVVAGLTADQLRDKLAKAYAAYVPEPEMSVIVREIHSVKVSVMGKVKTAGRYELKSQATVLDALAMGGGFMDFAKPDRIFVLRQRGSTQVRLPFNYTRFLDSGDETNFVLQSGDVVVVP